MRWLKKFREFFRFTLSIGTAHDAYDRDQTPLKVHIGPRPTESGSEEKKR